MDYLSHLTIDKYNMTNNGKNWLKSTSGEIVIILNSVTNINKVKDFLKHEDQLMVTACLDNDDAGRRATKELRDFMYPKYPVIDASICYQEHKDINEYLISVNKQQQKHTVTSKIKIS
jgi:hypothetical protein